MTKSTEKPAISPEKTAKTSKKKTPQAEMVSKAELRRIANALRNSYGLTGVSAAIDSVIGK